MLSFCLRVLNMSLDFIINYSLFGKVELARSGKIHILKRNV